MLLIPLQSIVVKDRIRVAQNQEEDTKLLESILTIGLLHPLTVRKVGEEYQLLTGFRRYTALSRLTLMPDIQTYMFDNRPIATMLVPVFVIACSDDTSILIEYEENARRLNFTWQEEAQALARIYQTKKEEDDTTTYKDVADELDLGVKDNAKLNRVSRSVAVAAYLHHKSVADAPTLTAAFKEAQRIATLEQTAATQTQENFFNRDGIAYLTEQRNMFDLIITDPPYTMNMEKAGSFSGIRHAYEDNIFDFEGFFAASFTACKPNAALYMFCHIRQWETLAQLAKEKGWKPFPTPMIWHYPGNMGIPPWASKGHRRQYDTILFAIKGGKNLPAIESDVLIYPMPINNYHAAAKPVELYVDLIKRTCLSNAVICDPCAGSGTIFKAAKLLNMQAYGCEIDEDNYKLAQKNLEAKG